MNWKKFCIISIFVSLLIPTVFAAINTTFIGNWFGQWAGGNLDINIAKFIFFVLIMLLIYSLLAFFPGLESALLRWPVAILVSFLATAYITPAEVWTMLISYSALGIMLGAFLPILILVFYTFRAAMEGSTGGIMAQFVMWVVYLLFLIYRFIYALTVQKVNSSVLTWYGIAMIVVLAFIIGNSYIVKLIAKKTFETAKAAASKTVTAGAEGIQKGKEFFEALAEKRKK